MKQKHLYILAGVFVVLLLVYFLTKPRMATINYDDIVQTVVFGISKDDVAEIELYKQAGDKEVRVQFVKQENQWRTPTMFNAKIREYNMTRLIDDILAMTGKVASDDPKHMSMFNISDEHGVHLILKDQAQKPLANLIVGKRSEDYNEGFVRFAGKDKVYRVDKNILASMNIHGEIDTLSRFNVKTFLDMTAVKEDKLKLGLAGLVKNGREMVIERQEKPTDATDTVKDTTQAATDSTQAPSKPKEYEWVLLKKNTRVMLDQNEVDKFLRDVTSVYAQEVVDNVSANSLADLGKPARYGIDRAANALVLVNAEDGQRIQVLFGKEFEKDKGFYMLTQNDGLVYKVAKSKFDTIFNWFEELPKKLPKPEAAK